jgi:sugar phosphate isomerase/epimerase
LFLSSFFGSFIYNDYEFHNFAFHARYACELAAAKGITVVYECVLPLPRMLELLDTVGGGMKILYDTLNPYTFGSGDTAAEIAALGAARIDQVHVKDRYEDYKEFCLLGEGVGRYKIGVESLRSIDWCGWVVNESFHHLMARARQEDILTLLKEDLRRMRTSFCW